METAALFAEWFAGRLFMAIFSPSRDILQSLLRVK